MSSVREDMLRIATGYIDGEWHDKGWPVVAELLVDEFLSHPSVGIIKENQSCECTIDNFADFTPEAAYRRGKEDMRDANFKRIEGE